MGLQWKPINFCESTESIIMSFTLKSRIKLPPLLQPSAFTFPEVRTLPEYRFSSVLNSSISAIIFILSSTRSQYQTDRIEQGRAWPTRIGDRQYDLDSSQQISMKKASEPLAEFL
jgi:hypothetical protein